MKYISVCSGIEACTVAWHSLGWKAIAYSDIEPFPRALLQHYYPDVPLYGDFTTLKDESWIGNADLLVGGTPCQAFSIAGLRGSLSDDRGNLTLQFVRLADAIDNIRYDAGKEPARILWENVPGVLSTEDNAFGSFLAGLCGCDTPIKPPRDGWSYAGVVSGEKRTAAWRVMDAQYFGVAQRRRRIFVLATGGSRRWGVADALLPITESLSWNPRPCRKKGKAVTPTVTASSPFSSTGGSQELEAYQVVDSTGYQGDRIYNTEDAFGTLPSQGGNNGGGAGGLIAPTLRAGYAKCYNNPDQVVGTLRARDAKGVGFDEAELNKLVVNALDTECGASKLNHQTILNHTIAFNHDAGKQFSPAATEDLTPTLRAKPDQGTAVSNPGQAIRRLTPKECERLQGFDDDYTKIPFKGKMVGDAPRYKALGNSMAVPVMKYIGQQIQKVYGNEEK
jgi:DNA (cytosine-5)-methyltransferase 1